MVLPLITLIRPVITWAQVLGSYLYYLGGVLVPYMGNRGFQSEARAQVQSSIVQERNKAAVSYPNATTQVSDNYVERAL